MSAHRPRCRTGRFRTDPSALACAADRGRSGSAVPPSGRMLSSLTWASPRICSREAHDAPESGTFDDAGAPSADPPEASPRPTAPPCRQKGSSKASPGPHKRRGRTSTLGPPASDPRQTRSACSGIQHHWSCRSSHGCKREGQTTDAIDTKLTKASPVGVLKPCCTTPNDRTARSAI